MSAANTECAHSIASVESVFLDFCEQNSPVPVAAFLRGDNTIERVFAGLIFVATLPLLVALIALIRLTSRGPAIFAQQRVGKNGRTYTMFKLRSMHVRAESATGPVWSTPNDARMTLVGRWLRKTHLDELPQLWNVMRGEMSLVGPRPERPEFVSVLEEQVPGYCDRLRVRPGVTGLAQINLPADTSIADVRRKVILDVEYIGTADMSLYLRIIACTAMKVVHCPYALRLSLTGVGRDVIELGEAEHALALTPSALVGRTNGRNVRLSSSRQTAPHKPR